MRIRARKFHIGAVALTVVVACGDRSSASSPLPLPPRNFSHIRTYASFYLNKGDPLWTPENQAWVKSHIDVASVESYFDQKYVNLQLPYSTWQDQNQHHVEYGSLLAGELAAGRDPDALFYHFGKDVRLNVGFNGYTGIDGQKRSLMEDKIFAVTRETFDQAGAHYHDQTNRAYGDLSASLPIESFPISYDVITCQKAGESLYIGNPWRFNNLNVAIGVAPNSAWTASLEYFSAVGGWKSLALASDTSQFFRQSGHLQFLPPADWQRTSVNALPLYWLRIHCLTAPTGTSAPVFRSTTHFYRQYNFDNTPGIGTDPFARAPAILSNGNASDVVIVPGWDPRNDRNNDGFVDDAEFANLANRAATARFKWQSRIPAGYYTGRWLMNAGSSAYIQYVVTQTKDSLAVHPDFGGVFFDNLNTYLYDIRYNIPPSSEGVPDYSNFFFEHSTLNDFAALATAMTQDRVALIDGLRQVIGANRLIANWSGDPLRDPRSQIGTPLSQLFIASFINRVDGFLHEDSIGFKDSPYDGSEHLLAYSQLMNRYCSSGQIAALHDNPNEDRKGAGITLARSQLHALARYYLTANDCTLFDFQIQDYAHPWNDWFGAIEFNVGAPAGDWFAITDAPVSGLSARDNGARSLPPNIFARRFSHALILLKSRFGSDDQDSATVSLDKKYFTINADGSCDGAGINQVIMNDYQGIILSDACPEEK